MKDDGKMRQLKDSISEKAYAYMMKEAVFLPGELCVTDVEGELSFGTIVFCKDTALGPDSGDRNSLQECHIRTAV